MAGAPKTVRRYEPEARSRHVTPKQIRRLEVYLGAYINSKSVVSKERGLKPLGIFDTIWQLGPRASFERTQCA